VTRFHGIFSFRNSEYRRYSVGLIWRGAYRLSKIDAEGQPANSGSVVPRSLMNVHLFRCAWEESAKICRTCEHVFCFEG
jgi:hypothetical protein